MSRLHLLLSLTPAPILCPLLVQLPIDLPPCRCPVWSIDNLFL